jgi:hypothetical protein
MEDKGFSEEEESTRHEEESPEWLLTNLAERKRQMKVLKEKKTTKPIIYQAALHNPPTSRFR